MRKVTASAVILTALTGCGQNNGIPSNQWSFEVPAEDEISSLELSQNTGAATGTTSGTFVSSVDISSTDSILANGKGSTSAIAGGASASGMMGPAFEQPGLPLKTDASSSNASSSNNFSSALTASYQPLATRTDPVAQVKAFLGSSGSPSALTNREPYLSSVVTPALPTVSLPVPTADITAMLGDPVGIDSSVSAINSESFTSSGLPVIESSVRGSYSTATDSSAIASAISSNQGRLTSFQDDFSIDEQNSNALYSSRLSGTQSPSSQLASSQPSIGLAPSESVGEDGLPVLEPREENDIPIGTAILQDLQGEQIAQSDNWSGNNFENTTVAQNLPAQEIADSRNSAGSIEIEILPADMPIEASEVGDRLSVDVSDEANYRETNYNAANYSSAPNYSAAGFEGIERSATNDSSADSAAVDSPTVAGLQYSTADRRVERQALSSPSVYASLGGEASTLARATAYPSRSDLPTLESLLKTMPETAAQPNFVIETSSQSDSINPTSPLLEGLSDRGPLSTLYMPIPNAAPGDLTDSNLATVTNSTTSADSTESSLPSLASLVSNISNRKDSLTDTLDVSASKIARLQDSRKAILSLVDKPGLKRRQLMLY